jgi:NADH dehydrogenase FAD-containing subunit
MLGGECDAGQDQLDVVALANFSGANLVEDEVIGLDPAGKRVWLRGGVLDYDVLSVSLGSEVRPLPGQSAGVFGAKPIERLWALRRHLEEARFARRILVAGGGMTACELAFNLAGLMRRLRRAAVITMVVAPGGFLSQLEGATRARLRRALQRQGILINEDGPVLGIANGCAGLPGGELAFDVLVNATGLRAPEILRSFGVPLDTAGSLRVDACLRSIADRTVHGAGDCIAFADRKLPKAGVFAVRQGPVLLHNLQAAVDDRPARPFRPQQRHLWIMNLGDGTGLATYGGWHAQGRVALWMKNRLDRQFLSRLRVAGIAG